eukprot:1149995-Pelagomonas_calceolata.AAC.6
MARLVEVLPLSKLLRILYRVGMELSCKLVGSLELRIGGQKVGFTPRLIWQGVPNLEQPSFSAFKHYDILHPNLRVQNLGQPMQ